MKPVQITREPQGGGVEIRWDNGQNHFLPSKLLREHCPCATCNERRGDKSHSKPLQSSGLGRLQVVSATAAEELRLESISSVGNYAISLRWGDGHSTGIYSFQVLQQLVSQN